MLIIMLSVVLISQGHCHCQLNIFGEESLKFGHYIELERGFGKAFLASFSMLFILDVPEK